MAGFGERLRRERELRGIKLEEIAESTKIGVRYLRALEEEDLGKLPGGIFSKGFVRAYARYLGIDEEEAIADFVHVAGDSETALPEPMALPEKPQVETHYSKWWLVLAVLALIAVGYYYGRKPRVTPPPARAVVPQVVPQQLAPPATTSVTAPAAPPPGTVATTAGATTASGTGAGVKTAAPPPSTPAPAAKVVVELHSTRPAWVQWSVDDGPTQDAVFPANAQKRLEGNARVKLKVGDAGAVELTYNGKTMSPLGKDKEVKTLTFTPEGMQE